jgi:hypothetical protein
VKFVTPGDAIHFSQEYEYDPDTGAIRPAKPRPPPDPDASFVICTGVDVERGVVTFTSYPRKEP